MSTAIDPSDFRTAPSVLSADFARLSEKVRRVLESGADWIHFDVMGNHCVSNLAVGSLVCEAIRPYAQRDGKSAPIDVHLVISPVDCIIPGFAKAGADLITFHPEASEHIDRSLALIRGNGCKAGLVFNPATPLHYLDHVMDRLDIALVMSVNPGFGGQSFIPKALNKLHVVHQKLDAYQDKTGQKVLFEIDEEVKTDNITEVAKTGAGTFVTGPAVFGKLDADGGYRGTVETLCQALASLA